MFGLERKCATRSLADACAQAFGAILTAYQPTMQLVYTLHRVYVINNNQFETHKCKQTDRQTDKYRQWWWCVVACCSSKKRRKKNRIEPHSAHSRKLAHTHTRGESSSYSMRSFNLYVFLTITQQTYRHRYRHRLCWLHVRAFAHRAHSVCVSFFLPLSLSLYDFGLTLQPDVSRVCANSFFSFTIGS